MIFQMEIGGVRFDMDSSAISALRYRAEYGESVINVIADCTSVDQLEGQLLRMCHMMIPEANRPELPTLARLARKDPEFVIKAQLARMALLGVDPKAPKVDESPSSERFDEYQVLSLMACGGIDMALLYELPIMHIVSIIQRAADLKDPDKAPKYREMTNEELSTLYPRRKKHG